jgi:ElaB/YqjD/DUF883 family membrane-anchored ribosome-binding protein
MSESTARQDEIEQGLERTRARMDSRLTELQGRLSPGQILDDLMGYFRGSEGGDFARNLVASVKSNPMPAALTGISLAWLMAANPRAPSEASSKGLGARTTANTSNVQVYSHDQSGTDDLEQRFRNAERSVPRHPDDTDETYSMRVDDARGAVVGVKRGSEDTAQSLGQRIQDALAAAKTSASETASSLRDHASDAASQLATSAHGAGDQIAQGSKSAQAMGSNVLATIADNPMLLGAIGLAVGALLGALVPQSEQEETALAGMAGQARKTAQNLGQEVMDRGGRVAHQVLDAGRDSAREHELTADKSVGEVVAGLQSGDLAGTVKQVAKDLLQSGDEAIRKDGLKTDVPMGANGSTSS